VQDSKSDLQILNRFRQLCQRFGIKLTYQRLEIFRVLLSSDNHPSAEEVYERVKEKVPTISLDTVYRTLSTFEQLGLIRKIHGPDDRARFDPNNKKHYHLVCLKCYKITDFEWPELDNLSPPESINSWGKTQNYYLEIRGICKDCLKKEE